MTDRATLLALASRVEAATATEQREMLEAAFVAVHGPKPERVHGGSPEWLAWLDLHNPFFALLQAGGFLDAAMSLVPSGQMQVVDLTLGWNADDPKEWPAVTVRWYPPGNTGNDWHAMIVTAATPALALTAASLRAIAGSLPND